MEFTANIRSVDLDKGEVDITMIHNSHVIKMDLFTGCRKFKLRRKFQLFILKLINDKKGKIDVKGYLYNGCTMIVDHIVFRDEDLEHNINNFIVHVRNECRQAGLKI